MSKLSTNERMDGALRQALSKNGLLGEAHNILRYSLLSSARMRAVIRASDATKHLDGESAEIGCCSAGTSRLIVLMNRGRRHWACDTFEGLVDAGDKDGDLKNGDFGNDEAKAAEVAARNRDLPEMQIVQGYFPSCAPEQMQTTYRLVHLDTDTYRSMVDCFEWFAPRMVRGGVMLLDDVIGRGTEGGKKAWRYICDTSKGWEQIEENDPQVVIQF